MVLVHIYWDDVVALFLLQFFLPVSFCTGVCFDVIR
jgi:hypothetical protein